MSNNTNGNLDLPSEADLAALAALIIRAGEEPDESADSNLHELLDQLDSANNMAQGMEEKLDKLLAQLDGMVQGLESAQTSGEAGRVVLSLGSIKTLKLKSRFYLSKVDYVRTLTQIWYRLNGCIYLEQPYDVMQNES